MKASEVRESFLNFFRERGHRIVQSAPVVPNDDPTLLFTNAGMNQFKDVFLGTGTRPYKRAANSQKCIRVSGKHNDLEEVGHDGHHHTFFEMMGNWSFGDYYKKEAIAWAWKLVTDDWGLPKSKLYATVFREDDEAESIWKSVTDIDPSHVCRFDEKENFWEMGETGPCGPCSEIHIDLGEQRCEKKGMAGHVCGVNSDCRRIIELWNLVFIQYNRDESGKLTRLPKMHVDTGLGLERAVAVLQGKESNYHTDLFMPILEQISRITGKSWEDPDNISASRVIADHIRALTFSITDGAIPSNEGRGYVVRRLLRRASRYGRKLGMHEPFMYRLVQSVVDIMGDAYPEIAERIDHTTRVIKAEEERFNEVLDRGIENFERLADETLKRGTRIIPGKDVFQLYDTYGFPLDLTKLMARERDMDVDEEGFEKALNEQRKRAKRAERFTSAVESDWQVVTEGDDSLFIGYDRTETEAFIRKFRIEDNGTITVILDRTVFYGEAGGQVGDTGYIKGSGFKIEIHNTWREGDMILHRGSFVEGDSVNNKSVKAAVDMRRRLSIARNHTATHLLHKALRKVLGDRVNQSGSLVAPERLRFDFTHFEAMSREQIDRVEREVNLQIMNDLEVNTFEATLKEAKDMGATALFGEKYGENVRVVKIDDYSMELCGGTHLKRTGEIGYFRIIKEEGVAAGVRRIEAVTGERADELLRRENQILLSLEDRLRCRRDEIELRVLNLIKEKKEFEKRLKRMQSFSISSEIERIIKGAVDAGGVRVVASSIDVESVEELRNVGDRLREKLRSGVGLLSAEIDDKINFLCVVTDDLIKSKGLRAGEIVNEVAKTAGGSGGGRPHMALAGARDKSRVKEALKGTVEIVKKHIE